MDSGRADTTTPLDKAVADLARGQYGLFTQAQLQALAVTRRQRQWRLQSGRWVSPFVGVYRIAGVPTSWRSELLAACFAGDGFASHRAAAALWGVPGGRREPAEITTERWQRGQHANLFVHETLLLGDVDTTVVDGIPCTTIERTIFDLCGKVAPMTVDLAIDHALRTDLTTCALLVNTETRVATRGRPGARVFHELMSNRSPSAATPESAPERLLARELMRIGLPEPVAQFVVRDGDGREVARCDLAYPQWRIVIEYDSVQEHVGRAALMRDSARRNAIAALGYVPVTATSADLDDGARRLASVIRQIRDLAA